MYYFDDPIQSETIEEEGVIYHRAGYCVAIEELDPLSDELARLLLQAGDGKRLEIET